MGGFVVGNELGVDGMKGARGRGRPGGESSRRMRAVGREKSAELCEIMWERGKRGERR